MALYPCVQCDEECVDCTIQCSSCDRWVHSACVPMNNSMLSAWLEPSEDIKAPAESDRDSEMKEDEQSREYDSRKAEYHHLREGRSKMPLWKDLQEPKIHQSRSGCSRGIVTEQRTDLSGETQENPSQDTNHSVRNLSASVTSHDSSQNLNGEEHITQQKARDIT
ncbi:unnamed protein product [Mytilus coruscus]|uniref:Zinc finger PHD-type domain-containing protein n=1 Tax=Mytilus coruscus TaxID=42192 RepID=A0A6J8E1H3_MYTCO|nr:unnamed protein product [Mytilus coruscus]